MKIKVGDKITVRAWDRDRKEGIVNSINIALEYHDKRAEMNSAIQVEEYDTELDYIGTVSYGDNNNWSYFNQIISVIPKEDIVVGTYDKVNEVLNGL